MEFIDILLNKSLAGIGRASNMCWIIFGEILLVKNFYGKDVEKGEYSLHLQCPWRIVDTKDYVIKLASGDIYEPRCGVEYSDDFNWEIQGNNLFDEKAISLFPKDKSIFVKEVSILESGDLRILFSNMLMLECFINISAKEECWRFFKQGDKKHLVVCGNSQEFQ